MPVINVGEIGLRGWEKYRAKDNPKCIWQLIILLLIVIIGGTVMIWREGAPPNRARGGARELKELPPKELPGKP